MKAITILGDSITFGRGGQEGGWVGLLKKHFERQDFYNVVYNLGIPGDTSKSLLKRFDVECHARIKYVWPGDKHILIVAIGTNDSRLWGKKVETQPGKFRDNIVKLINLARKYTKHIVFVGLTPVVDELTANYDNKTTFTSVRVLKYNNILREVCSKKKVKFLNLLPLLSNFEEFTEDGLHPNQAGYQKMFGLVKYSLKL
jgi:lysophospholipase L1-like esterase